MSRSRPKIEMDVDTDKKPNLDGSGNEESRNDGVGMGVKPTYGFEGIPSLPPKWTYTVPEIVRPTHHFYYWS